MTTTLLLVEGLVFNPKTRQAKFKPFLIIQKEDNQVKINFYSKTINEVVATYTLNNGANSFHLIETIDSLRNLIKLSKESTFDLKREILRIQNIFNGFNRNQIRCSESKTLS